MSRTLSDPEGAKPTVGRSSERDHEKKIAALGRLLVSLFAVLVHIFRHFEVVLQSRERLARPVLQLRIVSALGVALEERRRVLVAR